jgi:hypothetical protein
MFLESGCLKSIPTYSPLDGGIKSVEFSDQPEGKIVRSNFIRWQLMKQMKCLLTYSIKVCKKKLLQVF